MVGSVTVKVSRKLRGKFSVVEALREGFLSTPTRREETGDFGENAVNRISRYFVLLKRWSWM